MDLPESAEVTERGRLVTMGGSYQLRNHAQCPAPWVPEARTPRLAPPVPAEDRSILANVGRGPSVCQTTRGFVIPPDPRDGRSQECPCSTDETQESQVSWPRCAITRVPVRLAPQSGKGVSGGAWGQCSETARWRGGGRGCPRRNGRGGDGDPRLPPDLPSPLLSPLPPPPPAQNPQLPCVVCQGRGGGGGAVRM